MSLLVGKLRVLIATTNGPVEVQLLTEEDPIIGRSVACIGGTTETADIAGAYHAFVARSTGLIEGRFGHSCFRLDLSGRIDAGSSWQLGVLAAHALLANGRLAQEKDIADGVLWATGSVRAVDLTVGAVSHVPEKLANSIDRLREERAAGRAVLLAVPAANAAEVTAAVADELSTLGIEFIAPAHAQALFDALAMELPTGGPKGPLPALDPPAVPSKLAAPPRRRYGLAATLAAFSIAAAAAAIVVTHQPDLAIWSSQPAAVAVLPEPAPTEVAERVKIDPERVPFVTEHDRERIRDEYMSAPNYKALAASFAKIAFVAGEPSQEAADEGAMEACKQANVGITNKPDSICDLYASGVFVVTHRNSPPLPPLPWINTSVMQPFDAAKFPMTEQKLKKVAEENYPGYARSKAIVLSPNGRWYATFAQSSPDEAMRRTLERCGYAQGAACLVVAVEDTFVIAIPTLARAVGFYRPEALFGVQADEREEVAHRLANATEGWNAVAVGAAGHVGISAGEVSERKAVDDALVECANHDQNCHIAVIGPFLAEEAQPEPRVALPLVGNELTKD